MTQNPAPAVYLWERVWPVECGTVIPTLCSVSGRGSGHVRWEVRADSAQLGPRAGSAAQPACCSAQVGLSSQFREALIPSSQQQQQQQQEPRGRDSGQTGCRARASFGGNGA